MAESEKPKKLSRDFYVLMLVIHLCCFVLMAALIATMLFYGPVNGATLLAVVGMVFSCSCAIKAATNIDWRKF